jgi:hypothetical protein
MAAVPLLAVEPWGKTDGQARDIVARATLPGIGSSPPAGSAIVRALTLFVVLVSPMRPPIHYSSFRARHGGSGDSTVSLHAATMAATASPNRRRISASISSHLTGEQTPSRCPM